MKTFARLPILFCFFLTACAGPLVVHETARTVGAGNNELLAGYGSAGVALKWSYGLAEKFDLGVQWESLSLGVRAKYAFLNGSGPGFSMAAALVVGESIGGNHYYGDIMGSYLSGSWEPYGTVRIVHVNIDAGDFKSKDSGQTLFSYSSSSFNYGELVVGTRLWFNPHWLLSLEEATFFSLSSPSGLDGNGLLVSAAFGRRF